MILLRSAPQCLTLVDIPAQNDVLWLLKSINQHKRLVGWSQPLSLHSFAIMVTTTCVLSAICFYNTYSVLTSKTHIPHTFSSVNLFGMNFIQLFFCDRILQNRELL